MRNDDPHMSDDLAHPLSSSLRQARVFADFNRMDGNGRLRLSGIVAHAQTDFAKLAAYPALLFVDGEEEVRGHLVYEPESGQWLGQVDWDTQATKEVE